MFTKIFETTMNSGMGCTNYAFKRRTRTTESFWKAGGLSMIFILQGLIKCQLIFGKPLYICIVEFSKAFDLLNSYDVKNDGNASPVLYWQYMPDLGDHLTRQYGICITEDIIVHLLWADALFLISNNVNGLQKQLNGFLASCTNNCMIANEIMMTSSNGGFYNNH